jgi:transcriptional regulator with XRE-family HTH domain
MSEDLWRLRQKKGLSVQQLASKSGVPALSIQEYESGHPVRAADLPRLARALFVDEFAIKVRSEPEGAPTRTAPGQTPVKPPAGEKKAPVPKAETKPKSAAKAGEPARPAQIEHLVNLALKTGQSGATLAAEIGKPPAELTQPEVKEWLGHYNRLRQAQINESEESRPPDTRRTRAHLPEGVDEFEINYLLARQESGDRLAFTLFDGQQRHGRVVGFSPYTITLEQADGTEVTLQKLAIAYYQTERPS